MSARETSSCPWRTRTTKCPCPSRLSKTLQASASCSPAAGGPRADKVSDASSFIGGGDVAGGRTTALSTMGISQVGQSTGLVENTLHNRTLQGVQRELLFGVFVRRSPTPVGRATRLGGCGRTARCHRCRPARTPLWCSFFARTWLERGGATSATSRRAAQPCGCPCPPPGE